MTAEILQPFGPHGTPGIDEDVVSLLERTLAEARAGEIAGFAIAIIRPNGVIGTLIRHGKRSTAECAGAIAILQHDLLVHWQGEKQ